MSKTYLGNSGIVVMPVITATSNGWDVPLEDVHLSYPGYPNSLPKSWTYDDDTETINGYFSGRKSEGYIYGGYAVMAMNFPSEQAGIVDLEITFKRNGGSGHWNEHYWITREPRVFRMRTDQQDNDYFVTNFSTAAGDTEFSIPDSGTVTLTIKDFDFDNDYLYVYAYCRGGGSTGKFYRPQITDMTYYYHDYKLSPVKLKGAESN